MKLPLCPDASAPPSLTSRHPPAHNLGPADTELHVVPDTRAFYTCVPGSRKANNKYSLDWMEFISPPTGSNN